jgi:hypothetical protein
MDKQPAQGEVQARACVKVVRRIGRQYLRCQDIESQLARQGGKQHVFRNSAKTHEGLAEKPADLVLKPERRLDITRGDCAFCNKDVPDTAMIHNDTLGWTF